MHRWKILVTAPRAVDAIDRYRKELGAAGCEVTSHAAPERLEESDLLPLVGDVDGIICGDDRITTAVLEAAPRLKVISKWGTGTDSVDAHGAARRGIALRNTPDAFSEPVADTVLGYMLMHARKLAVMSDAMKAGRWERTALVALGELTLGILGFGNTGRAVARRATVFGMRTLVSDIVPVADAIQRELNVVSVHVETLLRESDFVSLHADMRPENHRLLNAASFAIMKPTAFLVNTARGGLVDEAALVNALRTGRLGGAALDVFEEEPLPLSSPLREFPNVYLAPHNANSSPRAAERVHESSIRNVLQVLAEKSA